MSIADLNARITDTLTLLQQVAPAADSAVGSLRSGESQITVLTHSIVQQMNDASGSFANLLKQLGQYQAFGGMGQIGPTGEVGAPVSLADLFQKLATLVEEQKAINSGKVQTSGAEHFNIEDSIQKIVQIIRTYGGPSASAFNLQKFKQFLESGGGAQAVAQSLAASPASSSAAPTAPASATTTPTPAGATLAPSTDTTGTGDTTAPPAPTGGSVLIPSLQSAPPPPPNLQQVQKEYDDVTKQLAAAQEILQHLQDLKAKPEDIAKQQKAADDLQKKLDDIDKQRRIAEFDDANSPATIKRHQEQAALQQDLDARKLQIDALSADVQNVQDEIQATSDTITNADDRIKQLRHDAGVDDKDGAVTKINDALAEAKDRLQYLTDTSVGATPDVIAKNRDEIKKTQADIDQMNKDLADASRKQRVADYEFRHSDAYKAQQKIIADAQAQLVKEQADLADREKRLKALEDAQKEEQKKFDSLSDAAVQQLSHVAIALTDAANHAADKGAKAADGISTAGDGAAKAIGNAGQAVKKDLIATLTLFVTAVGKAAAAATPPSAKPGPSSGNVFAPSIPPSLNSDISRGVIG